MRVMIKFTFPIDTGNDAMRSGKSRLRPRRPLDADVLRPLNANARQL